MPPRGHRERPDNCCPVRGALSVERLDAVDASRRVQVLVLPPVPALWPVLGRFLQVELQTVHLANRVEPVPRLPEREPELLVVRDRPREVVDQELRSEGGHPRLRRLPSHEVSLVGRAIPPNENAHQLRATCPLAHYPTFLYLKRPPAACAC